MRVVCDAGPLIALGRLGQLGLLLKLGAEILIPREVYTEVVTEGLRLGASDAAAVDLLVRRNRIHVIDVSLPSPAPAWSEGIDAGELAVILLAQQQSADRVLVDDSHARRAARQAGLRVKGTVGLLLEAFRRGWIDLTEFELLIQSIRAHPTLWISEFLCDEALKQARQQPH